MPFKGYLTSGQAYAVDFHADTGNTGPTAMSTLWAPRAGAPVPPPDAVFVAPGASDALHGTVPSRTDAHLLRIDVDVPEPHGRGFLRVSQGPTVVSQGAIVSDDTWTFGVK